MITRCININKQGASANIADIRKRSPLYVAAYRGYDVIVKSLLEKYANSEITDADGSTPLHVAIWANQQKTSKYLIIRGANVNHKDFVDGSTPLHVASRCHAVGIGIMLIQVCYSFFLQVRFYMCNWFIIIITIIVAWCECKWKEEIRWEYTSSYMRWVWEQNPC